MDNKRLETQAEDFIKSQLSKYDFKVTKPSFDKKGSDLIILDNIDNKYSHFLIVQNKGRTISNSNTNVEIPINYIKNNFILFIYTIDDQKNENLFLFFADDILKWKNNDKYYILALSTKLIRDKYFQEKTFNNKLANKIALLLKQTDVKRYTSIIIDGIFLQKAINKTIETYTKIWPEKQFIKPHMNSVIKNILDSYDRYKTETKTINCYLLLSESFDIENSITLNYKNQSFLTESGNQVRTFINNTNNIIVFEVLDQLNKLINNDNILLVADDILYESTLNELKIRGEEITVIMLNKHNESRMNTTFYWGDIMYPLGISCGLERHEL